MTRKRSLSLALACTLVLAGGPPRPKAKASPRPKAGSRQGGPAFPINPSLPAAGSAAEFLDTPTGKGRAVGKAPESLADFQATAFPDGRVLITGGSLTGTGTHWFDPTTRTFLPGPPLTVPRQGHRALLLADGRLLLAGGTEGGTAPEILDPGATRFQALSGSARFALSAEAVALDNGKVFLVDGASGRCWIWDGKQGFSAQGALSRPRNFFRATRLKDGRVLITGGWPSGQERQARTPRGARAPLATPLPNTPALPVECFNPKWGTFSTWKAQPQARARHQAERLPDGRVCLWSGYGADAAAACETMEVLDPGKESVTLAGQLPLEGNAFPAWNAGLFLAEHSQAVRSVNEPQALLAPAAAPAGRLANAYLAPTLVRLPGDQILVLGTPAWGVPVDRWDPRTRQCSVVGSLRAGATTLGLAPDGRVLVLGPVIDWLEPRTGALNPLGWQEDLQALLKTVKPYQLGATPLPPFPKGLARRNCLVVTLDKTRALVVGGTPEGSEAPSGQIDLWDLRAKTLTPMGAMKTRRAFATQPSAPASAMGALKLPDGSVLIWGPGQE